MIIVAPEVNRRFPLGLGRFIRLLRDSLDLTQTELALALSLQGSESYGASFLCKLEKGKSQSSIRFCTQLADLLGMTLSEVFVFAEILACEELVVEEMRSFVATTLKIRWDKAKQSPVVDQSVKA